MSKRTLEIWRGDPDGGEFVSYEVETEEGMVVLDAVLEIQASQAPDLAVRWNCKAAKCGSCSRRDQRQAAADVQDADSPPAARTRRSPSSRCRRSR